MIKLSAKVETSALKAYDKRLAKNMGKPLAIRAERGIRAASQKVLVPRIKAAAPKRQSKSYVGGGYARGGKLKSGVRSVLLRKRGGEFIRPTKTHSKAFYAHMVIGGTRPHSLGKRGAEVVAMNPDRVWTVNTGWMHPGATANPFIDRGTDGAIDDVWRHVERDVFDIR